MHVSPIARALRRSLAFSLSNRPGRLVLSIALTHFAGRAGDHNDRATTGSRLLVHALGEHYGVNPTTIGSPSPALSVDWQEELDAARPDLVAMQDRYDQVLSAGQVPVGAISRCAVALATLPALARHRPDAVVVWFDAHADINTPDNTTTGYLGGLALSGPLGLWDSGLGAGLDPRNAILAGVRDIDPAEQTLIDAGTNRLVPTGPDLSERLRIAIAGRPVYMHLDCDVLEPGIVPTDYQVPRGLNLDTLHQTCSVLAESRVVGVEIGELEADPDHTPALTRPLLHALEPVLDAAAAPAADSGSTT